MGIKGTVRRSIDGHIIHANIDADIIIAEKTTDGNWFLLPVPITWYHFFIDGTIITPVYISSDATSDPFIIALIEEESTTHTLTLSNYWLPFECETTTRPQNY
jgi:hypothetical protein